MSKRRVSAPSSPRSGAKGRTAPPSPKIVCAFLAEFDDVVGPTILADVPSQFMTSVTPRDEVPRDWWDEQVRRDVDELDESSGRSRASETAPATAPATAASESSWASLVASPPASTSASASATAAPPSSLFDCACEYIITQAYLSDRTLSLSRGNFHVLSRGAMVKDGRYTRNNYQFSAGFVLDGRIVQDIRPYRAVLVRWTDVAMEREKRERMLSGKNGSPTGAGVEDGAANGGLTSEEDRERRLRLRRILLRMLTDLNANHECHMILAEDCLLSLKLFASPRPPPPPLRDFEVPILLRPEWQLHPFDMDLTINWIVPHIDGHRTVCSLGQFAEVDLITLRDSLRLLRHHGILTAVDVFRYGNIYECMPAAASLMSTGEKGAALLEAAYHFVTYSTSAPPPPRQTSSNVSPSGRRRVRYTSTTTGNSFANQYPSLGTPMSDASSKRSVVNQQSSMSTPFVPPPPPAVIKYALAELYCSFTRDKTFGELLLSKLFPNAQEGATHVPVPSVGDKATEKDSTKTTIGTVKSPPMNPLIGRAQSPTRSNSIGSPNRSNAGTGESPKAAELPWKNVLQTIDHRRLLTFGVIHGLVRRVHAYPISFDLTEEEIDRNQYEIRRRLSALTLLDHRHHHESMLSLVAMSEEEEASSQPLLKEMPRRPENAAAGVVQEGEIARTSAPSGPRSPVCGRGESWEKGEGRDAGGTTDAGSSAVDFDSNAAAADSAAWDEGLTLEMAMAMDGTRCDDELCSTYGMSLEDIIAVIKAGGRKDVTVLYAARADTNS